MAIRLREVTTGTLRDFAASWRTLIVTDLIFKLLVFALLSPILALVLRWLLSRRSEGVVADADIARFFLTSLPGLIALIGGLTLLVTFSAVEAACLMRIAFAASHGSRTNVKGAMSFGAARAAAILGVAAQMVVRALAGVVPFVAAIGLVYLALLRGHDINYFLARKPPVFWVAVILAGAIVATLGWLAVRTVTRWSLAFPLLLFEGATPRGAIRDAAARSQGNRARIALVLAAWAIAAIALSAASAFAIEFITRNVAPQLAGSAPALIAFLASLTIVWVVVAALAGAINFSLFALLLMRIWFGVGPANVIDPGEAREQRRLGGKSRAAIAAVIILVATGLALIAFLATRRNERVVILAHRGSSLGAPENTLAAFRLAIEEKADMIELDVQESLDGEVLVVHDSDLMKIGGSPMKIWEHTAAELRTVDIGKGERIPTLAEVLAACKGKIRVMVELKSYGHAQNLEERVAQIVEAAGMQSETEYMSLNHDMFRRMKSIRPQWRVGALAAKAVGDPTKLGADFLAVESKMATARFVRRAHRAGQQVYVWTVNDPASMLTALSHGVDGLITDKPAVAYEVVQRRAKMSDAQRMLVALLLRAGVAPDRIAADLRP